MTKDNQGSFRHRLRATRNGRVVCACVVCLIAGIVIGGSAVSYKAVRESTSSLPVYIISGLVRNVTLLENLKKGDVAQLKKNAEEEFIDDFISIMESLEWRVTPELLGKLKGIQYAADYWRRNQFSADSEEKQKLFLRAIELVPKKVPIKQP